MKIGLIAPGIIKIPCKGWGAVEILIWDYYNELIKLNHDTKIINIIRNNSQEQTNTNSSYCKNLINIINNNNFDFVHLHYDVLFHILPKLNAKKIAFTSHYPYINNINNKNNFFKNIYNFMLNNDKYINFVLAQKDINFLIQQNANKNYIKKLENGIDSKLFTFSLNPKFKNKSIYLGKISERKKQYKYQNIQNIDFVGPCDCTKFNKNNKNYLGEWTRNKIFNNLTNYANLILLSDGEADPLVVKEALICGLGIVISQESGKNMPSKNFINIIDSKNLDNIDYIKDVIQKNKIYSLNNRNEIKQFAINNYDISKICYTYLKNINHI
jgi:hypothetical protein